ncbi:serine/threonine-protein kinase [Myxococcus sp. RHSTA-1-4]|uniref:serine/threonine-protein kinase n=1 Tax=Myxococcus sp. RHSTA-1-4 TaxID=2874601 RepID=UPI001CBDCD43|nr:serine/threonine-protein kinase [Myxococcus sp. RHSTA-1-4]MBZ4418805.1 serine/threonine protein kinase [Myxococcus sp. RHSTA-1-4]
MSFLLYPSRERSVFPDGKPLLWQLGAYVAVFQRPEFGTTGALLARRVEEDGSEHGDVLIHQLPTSSALAQTSASVFHEEWRLATQLSHPNILRTLDTWLDTPPGTAGDAPRPLFFQLVTEYVPGETLSSVLAALDAKGTRLPVPMALWVAAQVAHGLHAAHEATDAQGQSLGVLHRDVAPAHVLLAYDGGVKLSGFALARTAVRLMSGPIFKHVGSQPPEAQRKGSGQVDRRADVYGLGVTLYEALTGVDPFRRSHDYDSLKAAMSGDAPPPSHHRPELPPTVDAVVMRAMAPKAEDRYATAADFARALEALRDAFAPGDGREELAAFLRDLFGEERIRARTHVPTLAELRARAAALETLEALPPASEQEPEAEDRAPPTPATRFVPHSRLLYLYGGFLLFIVAALVANVAKSRESFVAEVTEVARAGQARAMSCLRGAAGERVRVLLQLDGAGHAEAKVEGPLAGTVAGRCIEEALAGLTWPRKRGMPVTVEVALDGP